LTVDRAAAPRRRTSRPRRPLRLHPPHHPLLFLARPPAQTNLMARVTSGSFPHKTLAERWLRWRTCLYSARCRCSR
jgi:hypothetical protein